MNRQFRSGSIVIRLLVIVTVLIGVARTAAADVEVVPFGAQWRYLNPLGVAEDPVLDDPSFDSTWFTPEYDDVDPIAWEGPSPGPFSYGVIESFTAATELLDPGEGDRFTAYFRHEFQTTEPLSNLVVDFLADDGAVIYLDGVEIHRHNCCVDELGDDADDAYPNFANFAGFEDLFFREPILKGRVLSPGPHVLAASVHQVDTTSSDLGFEMRLLSREEPDLRLIEEEAVWHFFRGRSEPSAGLDWTERGFDDSAWEAAREGFGYDIDVSTLGWILNVADTGLNDMFLTYNTVYLRKNFTVANPDSVSTLELTIDYDDSFIAYINGQEVARSEFGTPGSPEPFDAEGVSHESSNGVPGALLEQFDIELSEFPGLLTAGDDNVLAIQGLNRALDSSDFLLAQITLNGFVGDVSLMAGDANQDLKFDQLDLVQVQIPAKYLSGRAATWGEGDWDGAPGGTPGNPPAGNGFFDQLDVVAALTAGVYLTGPYAALSPNGQENDGQTSVIYDATTGEIRVDAPAGTQLTSINIDSAASVFTGDPAEQLTGSFDNDSDNNIFKATFGSSFGSISFGNVAVAGLSEQFVLNDLTVIGSLAGGGDIGDVDLIYVPEPATWLLMVLGFAAIGHAMIRSR